MAMNTVEFDASDALEEHVPGGAVVETVRYEGDVEIVEYREDKHICGECGKEFETRQAKAGHQNAHGD